MPFCQLKVGILLHISKFRRFIVLLLASADWAARSSSVQEVSLRVTLCPSLDSSLLWGGGRAKILDIC
jgi:hypothetical protein